MTFVEWLKSRGGKVHPQLDLFRSLENGDRGVVAQSDIAEGELLLLLPITCTLYIPSQDEYAKNPDAFPPAVKYLRESHPGLSPFLATTLALMSEVARGSASPWAAYVATLPPSCPDCLLHWSAEEKQELEGTSLEESGPDPASDAYRRHVAPILTARKDLWPGLADGAPEADGAEAVAAAAAAGAGGEGGAGLQAFVRTAGLVQSRAFHLEAENWVSGAKEISKLEGGATQVFLLPGIDMINHSHNPARRNARLERLNVAQVAAASLLGGGQQGGADKAGEGEATAAAAAPEAYFVMRADKLIKAGEEVLHTYGNLSDAQLLQTYGFLDSEDDFRTPAEAAAAQSPSGSKKRAKPGAKGAAAADAGDAGSSGGSGYRNPYNAALVPWSAVEEVCTGLLRSLEQAPSAALQRAKRDFLAAAGVLQAAAPEATQFVLLAQEPLPEELTTAVQVTLMTKEEFHELRREFGGSAGEAAGAKSKSKGGKAVKGQTPRRGTAGSGGSDKGKGKAREGAGAGGQEQQQQQQQQQQPKLSLGTALLEEDENFAEMVCIATLHVLDACMERYPTSVKDDVRLLRSEDCTGRERLAVRVRLGEKDVLQLAKKAVVELLRKLREGQAGHDDGSDDDDDEGDESEEGSEEEEEEEEGAGGEDAGEAGGSAARARKTKKQRLGLGAGGAGGGGKAKGEEGEEAAGGSDDDEGAEAEGDDGLLMGSDDSDKVGYGAVDYDDGIGEAHDRGKAHEAPQDDS